MRFEATKSSTLGTCVINIVGHVEKNKTTQYEEEIRKALPNVRYMLERMMHGHDVPEYPEFNMFAFYEVSLTTKDPESAALPADALRPGYDTASIKVQIFSGDCKSVEQLVAQYRANAAPARVNLGSMLMGLGLSPIQIAEHLVFFDKYVLGLEDEE